MYKINFIISMLIFGSIGLFVKSIPLSSPEIAMFRALIASVFLFIFSIIKKQTINFADIKKNLPFLIFSGSAIGFNWIFLFEAYKYTSVSNATVSYYFAPVLVMLFSPLILNEKFSKRTIFCFIFSALGILMISLASDTLSSATGLKGVLYGLTAATLYASVIIANKFAQNLKSFDRTILQLFIAALILLPYILKTSGIDVSQLTIISAIPLLILGIVHTGIAYFMYFSSIEKMKGQQIAILSYIDPAFAIILSVLILKETITAVQLFGCFLILGSSFISEYAKSKA